MLEGCHAYVIGKDEEHDRGLQRMATKLGFSSASSLFHKGVPRIDSTGTALSFLVHNQLEEAIMRSVITRIRSSDSDLIRFAPLSCFSMMALTNWCCAMCGSASTMSSRCRSGSNWSSAGCPASSCRRSSISRPQPISAPIEGA